MAQKRVVLFTAPGCSWCVKAKNFLKKYKIIHKNIDISKDIDAKRDCERHGCRGVPVILLGSRWLCGFDEKAIRKELDIRENGA